MQGTGWDTTPIVPHRTFSMTHTRTHTHTHTHTHTQRKEGRQIFWVWRRKKETNGGKDEEKCVNEGRKKQGRKEKREKEI